jgi:tRNA-2-methylthio-N6-dimethylallyladenosine synthase
MNLADSQRLKGLLQSAGYIETTIAEEADVILFNTCCVRQHAEDRLISRVRGLQGLKNRRPELIIGVGGCFAQKEKQNLRTLLPMVSLAFGPNDIPSFLDLLEEARAEQTAFGAFHPTGSFDGEEAEGVVLERPFSAFVNIVRGCTNFCAYCIVPHVRGPEVSRPLPEILEFVRGLADKGVTEITLLGQNVNVYGKDLGMREGFAELVEHIDGMAGIRRIRFLTSHPRDFSPTAIERLAKLPTLCEQYHLPLQAGANRVLALMNRGYTAETYLELVAVIRRHVPQACLTTDLICGFPSETEAEFGETLRLVEQIRFESAYMYFFSPRAGTRAADFPDQLPESARKERLARLIALQNGIATAESRKQIGRTEELLVESLSARDSRHLIGKTRTGRIVDFAADARLIGSYVRVTIERARNWTLSGSLAPDEGPGK